MYLNPQQCRGLTLITQGATAAYMYHLPAFEQLLLRSLSKYSSTEGVLFLLALTSIPPASLSLVRDRLVNFLHQLLHKSILSLDESEVGLGLLSIYDGTEHHDKVWFCVGRHWNQDIILDVYYRQLFDFVGHPMKAGKYFLCCHSYASAALKCLQLLLR